ncbi:MAG: NAD-binding protein, partial [Methylocella sp.]
FKGLLLGLFFVSIGASLDLSHILSAPLMAFGLALCIVLVKFCVNWLAGWIARLPVRVATEAALMLAPGGEFAFVIITAAVAAKAMPAGAGGEAMIAVTLSMFAVPFLGALAKRLARRPAGSEPAALLEPDLDNPAPDAIIVGFGRVGQLVGDMLHGHAISCLAVDTDPALVKRFRAEGKNIYWGNASRPEFLARCGLAKAKTLIITMDKPADAEDIVRVARASHPSLIIVARARDAHHATRLYGLGVSDAVPETIEASLQLSEAVLVDMGIPMGKVIASIHEKRDEFRQILRPIAGRAEAARAIKMPLRVKEMNKRQPKSKTEE